MNEPLALSDIVVEDRMRRDYGDIQNFANEIREVGLINPITLSPLPDGRLKLIAGGRRFAALKVLNFTHVYHGITYNKEKPGYLLGDEIEEDIKREIELKENTIRKDYTWQEECLNVYEIHQLRAKRSALIGTQWGQRETGRLLGVSVGSINNAIDMARRLLADDRRMWEAASMSEAQRIVATDEIDRLNAELARRTGGTPTFNNAEQFIFDPDALAVDDDEDVRPPPPKKTSTDYDIPSWVNTYMIEQRFATSLEKQKGETFDSFLDYHVRRLVAAGPLGPPGRAYIDLSHSVVNTDCIEWLNAQPEASFDHCVTDPPYGIDMAMLNQQNQASSIHLDRVEDEHDVAENEDLFTQMFPAVFRTLRDKSFFVFWCDIMQWDRLYNLATWTGFKVQRWPLTWHKTHSCMNQSAQYNFTKSTEIAMVCRKGNATLVTPQKSCVVTCSADDSRRKFAHPFAKPQQLTDFIINAISIEGQTIVEPFAGVGSIAIAILRNGRRCVAVEKVEKHYNQMLENTKAHYLGLNKESIFV